MSINFSPVKISKSYSNIAFGNGEVKLWSDFDGTLFPSDEDDLHKKREVKKLSSYFDDIKRFFVNSKGQAECNITTGRNFVTFFKSFSNLKTIGIPVIEPDRLVTSDGGDIYIKSRETGITVDYRNVDKQKRQEIKELTNWDGDYIRSSIIQVFKDLDIPLCQPLNLNPSVEKIIFPVLRNDGNLQICIDIPKAMLSDEFLDKVAKSIKPKLDEKNIQYEYYFEDYVPAFHRGPCIIIKPKPKGKPLVKYYDVQKAIEKATREKDLVIVAGDYINDYNMLNPETYAKTPDEIKKLPMIGIIVGNNPKLLELARKYPEKFVITKPFKLLEAVKTAIKNYADIHSDFELKSELRNQLETFTPAPKWVIRISNFFKKLIHPGFRADRQIN